MKSQPHFSRRSFIKLLLRSIIGSSLVGLSGLGYAALLEPNWIEMSTVQLSLPHLDKQFKGLRMVQISDIHISPQVNKIHLGDIVNRIFSLKPDMVVITGDFVSREYFSHLSEITSVLTTLSSQQLTLVSLGNHDHWVGKEALLNYLRPCGMHFLINDVYTLKQGNAQLHFAGFDDPYTGYADLEGVMKLLPSEGTAISLAHAPDYADKTAKTHRFDLQLSGHSHGGQVVLPFIGAPILPPLAEKYISGQYYVDGMIQYTNRGLGTVSPHIRINCRPEITLFILT
jgi:uncharacterized protein